MARSRDELIASALQKLGKRTELQSDAETEIIVVQETILEGHHWLPWFLETEDSSLVTVADTETVALPTDFLLEDVENGGLELQAADGTWGELTKDDLTIIRARYPDPGQPLTYALRGNNILLRPIPDAVYSMRLNYFARDTAIDTNVTNQWTTEAYDVMIGELCFLLASDYIKDTESATKFRNDADKAWARLYRKHIARREGGAKRSMGDS